MMIPIGDLPAFPKPVRLEDNQFTFGRSITTIGGMTYRQWLVGKAMQGLVASNFYDLYDSRQHDGDRTQMAASIAIKTADAVIKALDTKEAA